MSEKDQISGQTKGSRHWIGIEELSDRYWSDPAIIEKRGQEFYDKPIEAIDLIDKLDRRGIARRDFLTIMGASMGLAATGCARRPVNKIIPYVVRPEEITLGVAAWYASTYNEGDQSYGVLIKTRESRPIKLEGNPDHPVNRGKLSARAQGSLLELYDPERGVRPYKHDRKSGAWADVSYEDADKEIIPLVEAASGRVRVLTPRLFSDSTRKLVSEFLAGDSNSLTEFELVSQADVFDANGASYGTPVLPRYDFEKADVVVSIGADFLGTWGSSIQYSQDWAKKRKLDSTDSKNATMSKLFVFESGFSLTGSNADERFAVRSGDELAIAMALANIIIVKRGISGLASDSAISAALSSYLPDAVAKDIGLRDGVKSLEKVADALIANAGKSLVVAGGPSCDVDGSHALQVAVNLLNSALKNDGITVDGTAQPMAYNGRGYSVRELSKLIADMQAGKVDVLVIHRVNGVYLLPASTGFSEALKKVKTVIYVGDRKDETAELCDFVLPDHHFLESWGDAHSFRGVYSLQQPAIAPLFNTRAFEDGLVGWCKSLKRTGLTQQSENWHSYLQENWKVIHRENGITASFSNFWDSCLRKGVFESNKARGITGSMNARPFKSSSLSSVPAFKAGAKGFVLSMYTKMSQHDGRSANNAWLQEMPDPITTATWDNYLNVSPKAAKDLGLRANDTVDVTTSDGRKVRLPVRTQVGLHDQSVTVALGYGRTAAGKVGNEAGTRIIELSQKNANGFGLSGQVVNLARTGVAFKIADTQWHHTSEERPIINDITLTDYIKNPKATKATDPGLHEESRTMWAEHEYKGYKWALGIDLNSCTGCGACVVACQAENNIPVVGRENVRVSREMHWIRIDRYYSGSPENPEVIFQPLMCQQCDNAPCETVCPVLATVHSEEGLNEQVYNRCVGTRYCSNNCPYKVRRFNFFDHWKTYEKTTNLVWNPEVTVRTRGIMEKCTFCIQRIRDAKEDAKEKGTVVRDGEIQSACQQTCPTSAISFGNVNDPNSRVSKMGSHPREFKVLDLLNTKPNVHYLTKVRNREGTLASAGHHGTSQGSGHGGAGGGHGGESSEKEQSKSEHSGKEKS